MIQFQLLFKVADANKAEFERTFSEVFKPALGRQKGFVSVAFARLFSPAVRQEIQATPSEYDYQVNFFFESEQARRVWASSPDHDVAWPKFSALAEQFGWRGFDVLDRS